MAFQVFWNLSLIPSLWWHLSSPSSPSPELPRVLLSSKDLLNELLLATPVQLGFLVLPEACRLQQKTLDRTVEKNLLWSPEQHGLGRKTKKREEQKGVFWRILEALGARPSVSGSLSCLQLCALTFTWSGSGLHSLERPGSRARSRGGGEPPCTSSDFTDADRGLLPWESGAKYSKPRITKKRAALDIFWCSFL